MVARKLTGGLLLGLAMLAGCGGGDDPSNCDPIAASLVARVDITPSTVTLADGESVQLSAAAYSCEGSRLAPPAFEWQSGDATTVSVSASGMAVAVKQGGPVTVTAATQGKQGTARITVAPRAVASVRVEPAAASVAVGRTSTLVARAFDAQGGELPGRPVTWNSSNSAIVSVSPGGDITGVAIGGPVTITATIEGQQGTAEVTVVSAAVATVTVSPPSSTIPVGSTVQLAAVLRDDQGTVLNGRAVLWSTSDPARATVTTSGLVTGRAPGGPVTIVATSEGRSGSAQVTVSPLPLAITTSSLPPGTVGVPYSQTVAATGGVTPYSWSIASGSLPPGVNLSGAGLVSGTPTANGSFAVTLRVTDAASQSATQTLTLQVGAALSVTTTTLPAATVGASYSVQLTASGGTTPYSWTLTSGTLPAELSLSSTGTLSGTPTAAGSSTFIVQVTDAASRTATQALTLTVGSSLDITTTTLPAATVGAAYSQQLVAVGGSTPYSWSLEAGSPPPGLTLSAAGVVGGTPTGAGSTTFTVRVTDAASRTTTQSLTLAVTASLDITTTTLPAATVGTAYSQQLVATGGSTPYSWSLEAGSPPPGLTLSAAGVVGGTPTGAGSATFTVRVTDAASRTSTQSLTLTVAASLDITTTTLPAATVGAAYSQQLVAAGGSTPYSWSLEAGSPPPGLTLSAAGVVSGTPTGAGSTTFTVRATDAASRTATQSLTLTVNASLGISTTTLPEGTVGMSYSQQLSASGGVAPYTWTLSSGSLPGGLELSSGGLVSGTPTTSGSATFTVRVADGSAQQANQALTLTVLAALGITTTTLPAATSGVAYSQALTATGGATPYSWTVASGVLPDGLSLSGGGMLSGTPTTAGDYSFTVQVADPGSRTATQPLSVMVVAGAAAQIVWVRQPADTKEDDPIAPAPMVRVQDGAGNLVTTPVAVTMSITRPRGGAFTGSSVTTVDTVNGLATFDNLRVGSTGKSFRMRARSGNIQSMESENFRVQ